MEKDAFPNPKSVWTANRSPGSTSISSKLSQDQFRDLVPPKEVFWLGRKGGIFWDPNGADEFAHSVAKADLQFHAGGAYLDFGCSSGRTVRTFAAALPDCDWYGCDPISTPIEWAKESMPHIRFGVSPKEPPTDYADGKFNGAYAASVWSHFGKDAALAWFREMYRIVKPGGWLAFSTHGTAAIRHRLGKSPERRESLTAMWHTMLREGYLFISPQKGQVHPSLDTARWGFAFMTAEWVAAAVAPDWSLLFFDPARYGNHQDIYVLQRR